MPHKRQMLIASLSYRLQISTLTVVAFLAVWEIAPRAGIADATYTSQPSRVIAAGLEIISSGRFGTFWTLREITAFVALLLALFTLLVKHRPRVVDRLLPSINLLLGAVLFIAISLSSHAAAVNQSIVVLAVLMDWLHLMAAALWVGGMMYIATTYLPVLTRKPMADRAKSLVTLLPYFSPLAIAGIVIMAATGPFSAAIRLSSWEQLFTTAYGRALTVKIILVIGLLVTSAIHVLLIRPRLKKEYYKYAYAVEGVTFNQAQQVFLEDKQ